MEQVQPETQAPDEDETGRDRVPERGTLGLLDAAWADTRRRTAVIAPLAAQDAVPASMARDAGRALGLSERTIYGLLRLWRRTGGLVVLLAPRPSTGVRSKGRLTAAAEQIVAEAIRDEYLNTQRPRRSLPTDCAWLLRPQLPCCAICSPQVSCARSPGASTSAPSQRDKPAR